MNRHQKGPVDIPEKVVMVTGIDYETSRVMVRDTFNNEFELDGSIRSKGSGFPDPGERWLIERHGGNWLLLAQVGRPTIPVIDGSLNGLHPVVVEMFDALVHHGLVLDNTTGRSPTLVLDDTNDPTPDEPTAEPEASDVPPPGEVEDPGSIPPKHNGPKKDSEEHPLTGWQPLYLGTYNMKFPMGPQRSMQDMVRLNASKLQVVGLQEMARDARNPIMDRARELGWGVYRPRDRPNAQEATIIWRDADFDHLDEGSIFMNAYEGSDSIGVLPARSLSWVKLRHKDSRREFYFMDGHLLTHVEGYTNAGYRPGHASTLPTVAQRMSIYSNEVETIRQKMVEFGAKAPTFYVGDTNMDYYADARVRAPMFLYRQFTSAGAVCNWGALHKFPYGTMHGRFIDHLWAVRPKFHQVRFDDHWILTGYNSDHRPVMVKMQIKAKTRGRSSR